MLRQPGGQGPRRRALRRLSSRAARAVSGRELALGSLFLVLAGLWAFGVLAEDLLTGDPLVEVDRRLAGWLRDQATPGLTAVFTTVTTLGSAWVLVPLTLVAVGALLTRGRRADALLLVLALAGAEVLTLLKVGFERERPLFADPLAAESSFSFPSGHATVSLAVYGALGLVLAQRAGWRGRARGSALRRRWWSR